MSLSLPAEPSRAGVTEEGIAFLESLGRPADALAPELEKVQICIDAITAATSGSQQ